jgi:transketolase
MRKTFQQCTEHLFKSYSDLVLLLGDIGVHSFREMSREYPTRIYNVGILEQTMVSMAAGLSKSGLNPIIHSIAPFVIERPFEQIKIDFGYQKLRGNIVSVGASFDYSTLGATHHCPADVGLMLLVPGVEILIPGNDRELELLMKTHVPNENLSYFRLTENGHNLINATPNGKVIKNGKSLTVLAIGPALQCAIDASIGFDIEIIYMNTIIPFDYKAISQNCQSNKVLIIEPFYESTVTHLVQESFNRYSLIKSIGVSREFIHDYGTYSDLNTRYGLTVDKIKNKIIEMTK